MPAYADYRLKKVADHCDVSERTARRWRDSNDWRWVRACEEFEKRDRMGSQQREEAERRERARETMEKDLIKYLWDDDFWQEPYDLIFPPKRIDLGLIAEDLGQVIARLGMLLSLESKVFDLVENESEAPDGPDKQNVLDCLKIRESLRAVADRILPGEGVSPDVIKYWRAGCPDKDLQKPAIQTKGDISTT